MAKVMLIDGNSLTYRAFFALPTEMATASGQVTNAVFGFTSMLINLLRDHKPDRLAVAFDRPEPTFRHERLDTYKDGREKAPDILYQQLGLVREVVETLAIPTVELSGYEADDVIATLATRAQQDGDDVIVVTGDRDAYQLVEDPHIKVLYNKRGVSDYALYDEDGIAERTGVTPDLYVPYAALRGDKSDNLPGVPGVGEKTAAKLINTYGGIDGIYEHLDDQTPKLQENLRAHEHDVRLNLELMELVRDAPVEVSVDDLEMGGFDPEAVRKLFDFLEFRTLFDRLDEALDGQLDGGGSGLETVEAEVATYDDPNAAQAILAQVAAQDEPVSIGAGWTETVASDSAVLSGLAVVVDRSMSEVAWFPVEVLGEDAVAAAFAALTAPDGAGVYMHDAKPVMRALLLDYDLLLGGLRLDTMLAGYLLDPAEASYPIDALLERYAQKVLPEADDTPDGQLAFGTDDEAADEATIAGRHALAIAWTAEPLLQALDNQGLRELNDTVEVPLVAVLARMEDVGIGVDVAELTRLRDDLAAQADDLRAQVLDAAGEDFNVNSTKQLREILFDKLGLTPGKKTKTGYSTDAATLEGLRDEHEMVEHLLAYREVEKLRSTYGEGLLAEVGPGDRIRATFNQTVARTGRLSSDKPNLHNIPVRSDLGRAFRNAFVPAEGNELLVADYNQIELRCIAHLSEDPGLIAAFEAGDDIHTETASRIFDVDPDAVTIEQRSKAKMVSYGLAYGMESYGLGQRLGIATKEAQVILDAYFEAFPSVHDYMERTVQEARDRGYTETLFGRRRRIPELSSGNYRIRQAGERQAMNAGIQGLAADIFKVALVNLDRAIEDQDLDSRVVLQVHDEVIVEVPMAEHDTAAALVPAIMSDAFELRVPLEVNLAFGDNWGAAKA